MTSKRQSAEEAFFHRRMPAVTPSGRHFAIAQAAAPSLEKLHVTAPAPAPVTADELLAYAEVIARERAPRKTKKYGEAIALGDEVTVDLLGYANGGLIPFSARRGMVIEVGQGTLLPWLDEALLDSKVGDGLQLPVEYGDDEPVEAMRGAKATWLVDVVSAATVLVPEANTPEFLALMGGKTPDAVMEEVAAQLEGERVADAWQEARERVLDEVVARTEATVAPALVDEEIKRGWQRLEEPYLKSRNFEPEELKEALDGWLADPNTRLDAQRRLRLAMALQAIAVRDGLTFDREALELVADHVCARFGLSDTQLAEGMKNPAVHPQLADLGLHFRAVKAVLSQATVQFDGLDGAHGFYGPPRLFAPLRK